MAFETLDPFSRHFAESLFAVYPQWKPFAKVEKADGSGSSYLAVEVVPAPNSDVATGLYILTENDEVTIGFDSYHCHFDWPARDTDLTVDPMAFVSAILDERVAVVSVWEGEKWCGSWLMIEGREPDHDKYGGPGRRLRIRSWNGTLDRDVTPFLGS
ncbi:MAG TPA: hypothetical protein VII56_10855 [Rhizomicrobium sp.]